MSDLVEQAAAIRLEKRMQETFGVSYQVWDDVKTVGPIARAYLTNAARGDRLQLSHERLGFRHHLVAGDRAYNNEKPESCQIPCRKRGNEYIFDYKFPDLGLQAKYQDLILVDGNWFVTWMPQELIDASRQFWATDEAVAKGKVTPPHRPVDVRHLPPEARAIPTHATRRPRRRRVPALHLSQAGIPRH